MNDIVKPKSIMAQSFKSMCLVENSPSGKGIDVTAFDASGQAFAKGKDFTSLGPFNNGVWGSFLENMSDMVGRGGKAVGDSIVLGAKKFDATQNEGCVKINLAKGQCDVTTVDGGGIPNKTVTLGVTLQGAPFAATPKP